MTTQKVVKKLKALLDADEILKHAVERSLQAAQEPGIGTLEDFYHYLDELLTHIPSEAELMPSVRKFYFILGQSPDEVLKKDPQFNAWMDEFVHARGDFLDTGESTATLESFISNPAYRIEDYIKGP